MARPLDPVTDVERVAELLDQTIILAHSGVPVRSVLDIQSGLATRLRDNAWRIRNGEQTDGAAS